MYGYDDKRLVTNIRFTIYLVVFGFGLLLYLLYLLQIVKLEQENFITIAVALVGWAVAVDILFLQAKLSLKHQLEAKAIKDIDLALKNLSSVSSMLVNFKYDIVFRPAKIPQGFWHEKASKEFQKIGKTALDMRGALVDFHLALESNEIAIIHLEHLYRFLTISISDLISRIENANYRFAEKTSRYDLPEEQYEEARKIFIPLHDAYLDIQAYQMDFRKIIQTELLSGIFNRVLSPRKPKPGFGYTLAEVATPEYVRKMIDDNEKKFSEA